jgi:competence protein ComEC
MNLKSYLFKWGAVLSWLQGLEYERLSLWSPVALGTGIGFYFALDFEPDWRIAALLAAGVGFLTLLLRRHIVAKLVFFVFLGFFLACCARFFYGTPMLDWPIGPVEVSGRVAAVEQHKGGQRILLQDPTIERMEPGQGPERIRVTLAPYLKKKTGDLYPGQHFEGLAKLFPLSEPLVPDGFDFRENAYFQGIGATGYVMGKIKTDAVEIAPTDFSLRLAALRQDLKTEIQKNLQGDRAGLATIFLTGDKSWLSEETTEAMRAVGLAHLLAIAGLHVGLVAGIVFFLSRALFALSATLALRFPIKKAAAFCALIAISFYTLQVGAPVPTRRAFIMTGLVLFGVMIDRVALSVRTIAMAAFVILFFWPQMLLSPGFQLSFAAVLGLISVGEMRSELRDPMPKKRGIAGQFLHYIQALVGMSVVAMLATFPFSLFHFQEGGLYSVLANSLAIPLTAFWLMPLCVFVDLLWPFGLQGLPLRLLDPGLGLLIGLSHKIGSFPEARAVLPPLSVFWMLVATFGGLFFCLAQGRKRWAGLAVLFLGVGIGALTGLRPDVYVASDGRTVGWIKKDPPALYVTSLEERKNNFLLSYWAHQAGMDDEAIRTLDTGSEGDLACTEEKCVWQGKEKKIAWLKKSAAMKQLCAESYDLILNPLDDEACPHDPKTQVRTFESFYKQGALGLFVSKAGIRIETVRKAPALRPWSVSWQGDSSRVLPKEP